jgi:hypothetical protein
MNPDIVAACIPSSGLIGPDAGVAVCFVDYPGTSGDCATGGRCRPQPLTIGMTNYSALACGM